MLNKGHYFFSSKKSTFSKKIMCIMMLFNISQKLCALRIMCLFSFLQLFWIFPGFFYWYTKLYGLFLTPRSLARAVYLCFRASALSFASFCSSIYRAGPTNQKYKDKQHISLVSCYKTTCIYLNIHSN